MILTPTDPHRFWHSVAYSNYIQQFTGLAARDRPTEQMWREAVDPFFEILNKLRPDFVLVLGSQLWNRLPPGRSVPGEGRERSREYPTGPHRAVAVMGRLKPASPGRIKTSHS